MDCVYLGLSCNIHTPNHFSRGILYPFGQGVFIFFRSFFRNVLRFVCGNTATDALFDLRSHVVVYCPYNILRPFCFYQNPTDFMEARDPLPSSELLMYPPSCCAFYPTGLRSSHQVFFFSLFFFIVICTDICLFHSVIEVNDNKLHWTKSQRCL